MKKIVSTMLCVVLVFTLVFSASAAATLDFSFDKESLTLSVGGTLGASEHRAVMVYIFDASNASSDLSDSNPPVFADVALTGKDGLFDYTKVLSNAYPSGQYRVVVSSVEGSETSLFMYTNKNQVTSLLPQINGAASASALEAVITPNATALGIDMTVYNPIKTDVCLYLYGTKPATGFANADVFINSFDQAMAAARIVSGEDTSLVLKEYSKALSIDFENDYNKFDSVVKSAINTELKSADYTSKLLSQQYPELRTVAFVKAAPTWQALKNAFYGVDASGVEIVSNYAVINPDLTVFNKVSNKDNVFAQMFKQRASLTTVVNIRNIFSQCALSVYNAEINGSASGGSSSGGSSFGGGAASGPVTIQPGYVNQPTEVLKPAIFTDTDVNAWYYNSIERLVTYSLINGYEDKTFKPENSITRAEFTKLVVGIAKHTGTMKEAASDASFADVNESDWFSGVVTEAASAGLVTGADGNFNPNAVITRQDAAVILYRLISDVKTMENATDFDDKTEIADYAKEAVSLLAGANIISGMGDGKFAPTQNLTRAQAAKLLYGVLEFLS